MKKLLAIVLALTLILSVGTVAFADTPSWEYQKVSSPTKSVTSDDLPATTADSSVVVAPAAPAEPAAPAAEDAAPAAEDAAPAAVAAPAAETVTVIENKDLTTEQKATVDDAIQKVVDEGGLPAGAVMVKANQASTLNVTVDGGDEAAATVVVYVIYPDGTVKKFPVKDLTKLADGTYELPVDGDCVVVLATEA